MRSTLAARGLICCLATVTVVSGLTRLPDAQAAPTQTTAPAPTATDYPPITIPPLAVSTAPPNRRLHSYHLGQARVANAFIVGPGTVLFFGINPYRYPQWSAKVDDKLVAGPSAYLLPTVVNAPFGPTDSVTTDLSAATPPDIDIADFVPITSEQLANGDVCKLAPESNDDTVHRCSIVVLGARTEIGNLIRAREVSLYKATHAYRGLLGTTDTLIRQFGTIRNDADFDRYREAISKRLFEASIDNKGQRMDGEAVYTVDAAKHVEDWPGQTVATRIAQANSLADFYAARVKASAETAATQAVGELTKPQNSGAPVHAATRAQTALTSGKRTTEDLNKLHQQAIDVAQALQVYAADSPEAQRYAKSQASLVGVIKNVQAASLDRFAFKDEEPCKGLSGSRRDKIYNVKLFEGATSTVHLVCEPRMVLSGGVAFTGLSQPTYEAVPDAPATAPPPPATGTASPTPAPAAHIRATTQSYLRPTAVIMNNVRLSPPGTEQAFYAAFGLGVLQKDTGELTADYLAGVSFSLSKTIFISVGAQFGKTVTAAPGYEEGALVPANTKIQTLTKFAPQLYVAITFGRQ
ncbi:MAG: hypothetical protein JWM87_2854 [Candidatus Eremiobacteraeota bacterium]|nr:hypothetical protein [Candidatus Eremiobacteraeota bacterium]